MVDIGPTHWPSPANAISATHGNLTVDAASEVAAFVFRVSKAGTITRIHFRTNTVTTGATLDLRLETVDLSNGRPSGTLFGTNTNVAHVLADTDDNLWIRSAVLTGSATVAINDLVAVVIANPAASFGNFNVSFLPAGTQYKSPHAFPYCCSPDRATKLNSSQFPCCALEYDDGTFTIPEGAFPVMTSGTVNIVSGSTPDEVALYFTALGKMRVVGWWAVVAGSTGGSFRVNLYESGNNTPLLTKDYDADAYSGVSTGVQDGRFDASQLLTNGTVYRLGFADIGAVGRNVSYWEVASAHPTLLDNLAGKSTMHYSQRLRNGSTDPDAATWTQTTNRRILAGLKIDQVDDGAGAGGGGVIGGPNMRGGMAA